MLLNKIIVNNLGVFAGKHIIDLSPKYLKNNSKPIVIFGGMNGSGKTTIFDAIKLCLYGKESFPHKNGAYNTYLKEKINNSNSLLIKPNFASVGLDFEFSTFGDRGTYQIERSWELKGKKINEKLTIKKNGEFVDEVSRDQWQTFIKEMLPIGLSQLFFFDGEMIQKMMHDDNNTELKQSIMTLLGLDLVQRLRSDLKIYKRDINKKASDKSYKGEIEKFEAELTDLINKIKKIKTIKEDLEHRIEKTNEKISSQEDRIEAQGGGYFKRKNKILEKKNKLASELEVIKEKIKEIASGLLPISIPSALASRLKDQVTKESIAQVENTSTKLLKDKLREIKKPKVFANFTQKLDGINIEEKSAFKKSLIDNLESFLLQGDGKTHEVIHGLSSTQSTLILNSIDMAINAIPNDLQDQSVKYENTYRKYQETISKLDMVPDESTLKPAYNKLSSLKIELGELSNELKHVTENLNSLNYKRTDIERKLDNQIIKGKGNVKVNKIITLIKRSEIVLDKFKKKLSAIKVKQLEKEFTKIFLSLHRKEDLISKIHIDPETFDVYVYDRYGSRINKNNLSSGELEMYAISMVWALAIISGQKLPFAIDTPLARLDSKHRDNLISKFFPHASHQMLVFSTNTEVDEKYFEVLKPYVAKAYKIEYIDEEKRSEIDEGYFWN